MHVAILSCQHVAADKRVTHKTAISFRQAGFRTTWIGPGPALMDSHHGVDFRYYPRGATMRARLLHAGRLMREAKRIDLPDVWFAVEPDSAAVAIELASKVGGRAVFDIHEVYDREMLTRWVPHRFLLPIFSVAVRWRIRRICAACDLVTAVSDAVIAPYHGLAPEEMIIRNCASLSFARNEPATPQTQAESFRAMHGLNGWARGTAVVIEAMALVHREAPQAKVIMFDEMEGRDPKAKDKFTALLEETGARGALDLRRPVPMTEMPGVLRSCHCGLIAYDRKWGMRCMPNRFFEYMAMALPVIAPSYAEEIGPIVEDARCGLLVDFENPRDVADAMLYLVRNPEEAKAMGARGREAFLSRHNWEVEVEPLLQKFRLWDQQSD